MANVTYETALDTIDNTPFSRPMHPQDREMVARIMAGEKCCLLHALADWNGVRCTGFCCQQKPA